MKLKLRFKLLIAALFINFSLLFYWRHKAKHSAIVPRIVPPSMLLGDERERLVVSPHNVTIVTPNSTISKYIPNNAIVSIKKNGTIMVTPKTLGLILQPGLSTFYDGGPRIGLDAKFAYFGRLGLTFGAGWGPPSYQTAEFAPYLSGVYNVYSNTDLMLGYTGQRHWLVGMRISF